MNPVLSVIIPVYNGEKTLEAAIESVLGQTLGNIEIIIVNDGSHDATASIIEKYKAADPRIVFINKEKNEGLSAARNSGMKKVTGEYFTFLDADDRLEADAYERMTAAGNGAEIIVSGFYHDTLDPDGCLSVSVEDVTGETLTVTDKKEILEKVAFLDKKRLFAFTWNKLYKKSFIDSTGVVFENQTLIEDYLFNCKVFDKASSLSLVDGCIYHYIKFLTDALTQRYLPDYFEIMNKRYALMKDMFERGGLFEGENREIISNMHIKHIVSGFVKNCSEKSGLSSSEQKQVIKSMLSDESCLQAMKHAKGQRKQEILCNAVFSTKNVFLNFTLAKVLYKMQNSKSNLFDRLK